MITINQELYNKMPEEVRSCFDKLPNQSSEEVLNLFPDNIRQGNINQQVNASSIFGSHSNRNCKTVFANFYGSASRFFYCAKASTSERTAGLGGDNPLAPAKNNHPTVKPISLMRYLCRLVTPKGGLVLDPFGGSGTTGIGAVLEGFDFILIEQEEEYVKIAEARIAYWSGKGVAALSGSVSKKPVNNVKPVKQDNLVQVKLTDLM